MYLLSTKNDNEADTQPEIFCAAMKSISSAFLHMKKNRCWC